MEKTFIFAGFGGQGMLLNNPTITFLLYLSPTCLHSFHSRFIKR